MDNPRAALSKEPRPIIAAWDGSAQARDALALTATLARELGAPVRVVQVGPLSVGLPEFEPAFEYDIERQLEETPMDALEGIEYERQLVQGHSAAEGLHRAIAEFDAGMVVLGST